MKLHYYKETDSLYINLSSKMSVDSYEISPGVVIDYDDQGRVTGIDIDQASEILDLQEFQISQLPIEKTSYLLDKVPGG